MGWIDLSQLSIRRRGICMAAPAYIPQSRQLSVTHLIHVWLWFATIGAPPGVVPFAMRPDSGEVRAALDSTLAVAGEALARGRPWQATRVLSKVMEDPANRTPPVVFLA